MTMYSHGSPVLSRMTTKKVFNLHSISNESDTSCGGYGPLGGLRWYTLLCITHSHAHATPVSQAHASKGEGLVKLHHMHYKPYWSSHTTSIHLIFLSERRSNCLLRFSSDWVLWISFLRDVVSCNVESTFRIVVWRICLLFSSLPKDNFLLFPYSM